MGTSKIDVSIIIPARNEEANIGPCLDALYKQNTAYKFEVIVIDSGSTDKTVECVTHFPGVKLITIKAQDFGHGKTRNLGAKQAAGDYLLFLNADALPADENWLNPLIRVLQEDKNKEAVGVYSRQLPKENCHLYMARDMLTTMPAQGFTRGKYQSLDFMIFSTVSCAVRREIWRENPFSENIIIAEDQEWARRILNKGFKIVYEPASAVYHSHNYKPGQLFAVKKNVGSTEHKFKNRCCTAILGLLLVSGGFGLKMAGDIFFILFKSRSAAELSRCGRSGFFKKLEQIGIAAAARAAGFAGRYRGWLGAK
ncbi:MAG: glycosyltransferase [Candidatus Aminicenantes bacterium]|nr:glycosyltransferase [Candidatus Aminicenantes bacterium]